MHNERIKKTGQPGPVEPLINHGSNKSLTVYGYMRVYKPGHPMADRNGWMLEHRFVAYENGLLVGRDDRRHVHHKDHNKLNNHISNLEVLTSEEHLETHAAEIRLDPTEMVKLRKQGKSTVEISEILGNNPGTIWRIINRWERENDVVGTLTGDATGMKKLRPMQAALQFLSDNFVFKTGEMHEYLRKHIRDSYSRTCTGSILDRLMKQKKIKKIAYGTYRVIE